MCLGCRRGPKHRESFRIRGRNDRSVSQKLADIVKSTFEAPSLSWTVGPSEAITSVLVITPIAIRFGTG